MVYCFPMAATGLDLIFAESLPNNFLRSVCHEVQSFKANKSPTAAKSSLVIVPNGRVAASPL
jgi:hypothetical protein